MLIVKRTGCLLEIYHFITLWMLIQQRLVKADKEMETDCELIYQGEKFLYQHR